MLQGPPGPTGGVQPVREQLRQLYNYINLLFVNKCQQTENNDK